MNYPNTMNLSQNFINLLLDSMASGVFAMDEKGKINLWNRAMEKISGYTATEVMGQSCSILSFNL